jgi:hypothetical protein
MTVRYALPDRPFWAYWDGTGMEQRGATGGATN